MSDFHNKLMRRAGVEDLSETLLRERALSAKLDVHIAILHAALRDIDALALAHERGAIGKAQKIARRALEDTNG